MKNRRNIKILLYFIKNYLLGKILYIIRINIQNITHISQNKNTLQILYLEK